MCWHDATALIPALKGLFLCRVGSSNESQGDLEADARSSYVITMSRLSHSPLPSPSMQIAAGRTPIKIGDKKETRGREAEAREEGNKGTTPCSHIG